MYDVVSIGGATRDIFIEATAEEVAWPRVPSGRAIALPLGSKAPVSALHFDVGGNALNASVTFARQGLKTALCASVADDDGGRAVREILVKEGVATGALSTGGRAATAHSFIMLRKGERAILTYHGADGELAVNDALLAKLRAKWWYISLPGATHRLLDKLLQHALRAGVKVALNPSGAHIELDRSGLARALKKVHFLVVNESEASTIVGVPFEREKEVFKRLDEMVPGLVAVTSGKEGVRVSDGERLYRTAVFTNKRVVDRTGAGDAFGSGFLASLVRAGGECAKGACVPEAVCDAIRLGTANASSVVEYVGATKGALTAKAFEESARWRRLAVAIEKIA
ncbi:MAG: carbohydrate kinase family protein [Candidatus Colwellbacteria bacterium]|nr:carbohydrate kinase family protein [Candidatus Colwellbacteria bacterium]